MLTLTIVIPALNEYPGITKVIEDLLSINQTMIKEGLYTDIRIIVVDDGSTDRTGEAVSHFEDVQLITFSRNKGYGAALKSGFAAAKTDHLAFLDADGTYPPSELPKLCRSLIETDADIVVGSRLSGAPSEMPKVRYWGNRIFALLTSWASGTHVEDCASGMRVFKRDILRHIYPLPDGLNFTPAMTTRGLLEGLEFVDISISYHERVGPSKLNAFYDGFRFLGSILRMTTYYNPLKFFGLIGILLIITGLLYGLEPVYHYVRYQHVPEQYIYRLLAILAFWLGGLNIVAFGILANFSLAVIHKRFMASSRILRYFDKIAWYNRLDLLGILLIIGALLLNYPNIKEYLSNGTVSRHWSYLVTGAILVLSGIQLFTVHLLIRILAGLRQREELIAQDLGMKE